MEEYAVRKIIESFYNMEVSHLDQSHLEDGNTGSDKADLNGKLRALQELTADLDDEVITEAIYSKE